MINAVDLSLTLLLTQCLRIVQTHDDLYLTSLGIVGSVLFEQFQQL